MIVAGALAVLAGCSVDRMAQKPQIPTGETARTFRIVLPDEPKAWEKTAAEELEHYLGSCLGENRLTVEGLDGVVFHVGDTAFARENLVPGGAGGSPATDAQERVPPQQDEAEGLMTGGAGGSPAADAQ